MENDTYQDNAPAQDISSQEQTKKKSLVKPIIIAVGIVAILGIAGAATWVVINNNSNDATVTSAGNNKITAGGTYTFTGEVNGRIIIDTAADVTIILKDATITNTEESAAIKSKQTNNVKVILEGTNKITSTGDGFNIEGNLEISGDGSITIESGDDGIHADMKLTINSGTYTITAHEGLEATYVLINDGTISINASDDGINAAQKVNTMTPTIEINGGTVTIKMGSGDTDGLDSNGNIYINGGTVDITGQSTCDYDGEAKLSSDAKLIVNGTQVTTIPNQFMGGGEGMMGPGGQGGQMPSGEAPSGEKPSGEMPSGEMPTENGNQQQMQPRAQDNQQMRQRKQAAQ